MIDVRLLIAEVKKRPVIWDQSDEFYADKTAKKAAWSRVFPIVYKDFGRLSKIEQERIGHLIMSKWRNVKDGYLRSIRKKKHNLVPENSRPYIFAHHLVFLDRNYESSATTPAPVDDGDGDASQCSVDEMTVEPSLPHLTSTISSTTLMPEPHYDEPPDVGVVAGVIPSMGFFESLRPAIETFTVDEMLRFQTDVCNLVMKMRRERRIRKRKVLRRRLRNTQ